MGTMTFFGDPVWWVSVVIVGIVINFFSAYAKGWVDIGLSNISEKWRRSSDKRKQDQVRKVELLAESEYARLKAMGGVTQSLIHAVSFQILGFIGMYLAVTTEKLFPNWVVLGVGGMTIVCLAMSMASMAGAMGGKRNIEAAEKLNAKNEAE